MNLPINHVYGIVSENVDGFIEQLPNTKIDGKNTCIENIAFIDAQDTGSGIIYKNWTSENVRGFDELLYRTSFTADTTRHYVVRRMEGKDVVIAAEHIHKICGISTKSECDHIGINAHTKENRGFATYSELRSLDDFPTKGAWYLEEDYIKEMSITLTGDLYICLNGNKMKNITFEESEYKAYITTCQSDDLVIELSSAGNSIFNNNSTSIMSSVGSIYILADLLANINSADDKQIELYNVVLKPYSDEATNNSLISAIYNNNAHPRIMISSSSFIAYNTTDSLIKVNSENSEINVNNNISIINSSFKDNTSSGHLLDLRSCKVLFDNTDFTNNKVEFW